MQLENDPEAIIFCLKKRYTGVSATVNALLPIQQKLIRLAYVGPEMPHKVPPIRFSQALKISRKPPQDRAFRIWHVRRNNEMFLGIIARDLLRLPIKLVFTSAAQRRHSILPRWLISKMDAVICTSKGAAQHISNCHQIVPHGIDLERFPPPENKREAWKDSGLPGQWGIGIFGRIRPEKGTDVFVDAMIEALPKLPEVCAVIAGLVQPKHQEFFEQLKSKIEAANLSDRIVFLGEVPSDQVHLWYQRCLVCVACPRYEAFGLTPFEAASAGCAVIGTKTGAFADLAIPEQTGELIEISDSHGLSEAILRITKDPNKALEFGENARSLMKEKFAIFNEARAITDLYLDLFEKSSTK